MDQEPRALRPTGVEAAFADYIQEVNHYSERILQKETGLEFKLSDPWA